MPFILRLTPKAAKTVKGVDEARKKKLKKCFDQLRQDPHHPGLHTKKYQVVRGPAGEGVFESYVENNTPGAWRVWWFHGPAKGEITIMRLDKHPD